MSPSKTGRARLCVCWPITLSLQGLWAMNRGRDSLWEVSPLASLLNIHPFFLYRCQQSPPSLDLNLWCARPKPEGPSPIPSSLGISQAPVLELVMVLRLQVSRSKHWGHPPTKVLPVSLVVLKRMVSKVKLIFLLLQATQSLRLSWRGSSSSYSTTRPPSRTFGEARQLLWDLSM